MRRVWGIVLAVLLVCGVAALTVVGRGGGGDDERDEASGALVVDGVIGSEKTEFFNDPAVVEELAAEGFEVRADAVGSWAMSDIDLGGYDFAFPSSLGPAQSLMDQQGLNGSPLRPFYSPLVVLARSGAAEVLAENGLVQMRQANRGTLVMAEYLRAAEEGTTWQQLQGGEASGGLTGTVYISSSDPLTSNSGALYLAAASYSANGGSVVADAAAAERVTPLLRTLVQVQGTQQASSDAPFRDFISGIGNPLVLTYESQIASVLIRGEAPGDTVVLYPDTTVSSDHSVVPLTDEGRELGELLTNDPELRALAVRHGFRPQGATAEFTAAAAAHTAYLNESLDGVRQAPVPTSQVLLDLAERARGRQQTS